jgi:hypothetical protein
MSTRSLVGGLTDMGTYVVYVHFDGYPEGRLPVLDYLIKRDGAAKTLATILMANEGGWSYLAPDIDTSGNPSPLGNRGEIVEGYGLKYIDAPEVKPYRFPEEYSTDMWAEYVYLIPEEGPLIWAAAVQGKPTEEWDWQRHEIGEVDY